MASSSVVYLIHFDQPYYHAQHYIGTTIDLERRMAQHRHGVSYGGAHLLDAVNQAGISWSVVQVWEGDRDLEYQLKAWKKARLFCPVCCAQGTEQAHDDTVAESQQELFS